MRLPRILKRAKVPDEHGNYTFEAAGLTKDGIYGAEVQTVLKKDVNVIGVPKLITENGYINVRVKLSKEGRLLGVLVERWNIGQ